MSPPEAPGYQARVVPGVAAIPREVWTAFFPTDVEGWDYYVACEAAPPPAFTFQAILVTAADRIVAAAPIFRLTYRLDTPLQGRWRHLGDWLNRHFPRLVNLSVLGLGSPIADRCHLGFAPDLRAGDRMSAMRALIAGLDAHAVSLGVPILAVKDLADRDLAAADIPLREARFTRVSSLPIAVLDLPFSSEADYLASLSGATRKDIRRKLKAAGAVRVEMRTSIAGVESEILSLYDATRSQSGLDYGDFEKLSPDYFRGVMQNLGDRTALMLYWRGDELLGFNLLLIEKERVIDKFIGMRYPQAREHNLYVLSWMTNVRFCLERGIRCLQTGQTAYASKVRFGSRLDKSWLYYRHRGRLMNSLFRTFGPLVPPDKADPDLAEIARKARRGRSAIRP